MSDVNNTASRPEPPVPPDDFACCQSGCGEACVWAIYKRDLQRYEAALRAWKAGQVEEGGEPDA